MPRYRWVQDRHSGELIEVSSDYVDTEGRGTAADSILWNDRNYQDMGDKRFVSRKQHRDYMRHKGITTVDDFTETFRRNEQKRMDIRKGIDPTRKSDIARAIHQLRNSGGQRGR